MNIWFIWFTTRTGDGTLWTLSVSVYFTTLSTAEIIQLNTGLNPSYTLWFQASITQAIIHVRRALPVGQFYTHKEVTSDSHYRDSHGPVRYSAVCHVSSSVHIRITVRARSSHEQVQDLSLTVSGPWGYREWTTRVPWMDRELTVSASWSYCEWTWVNRECNISGLCGPWMYWVDHE
jgi:hypothetical protein